MADLSVIEQLQCSTVRIEATHPSGTSVGTGFFYMFERDGMSIPLIVTNRHVVELGQSLLFQFPLTTDNKSRDGTFSITLVDAQKAQYFHPDPKIDLALIPANAILAKVATESGKSVLWRAAEQSSIPSAEQISEFDGLEDVIFIGYPNGIVDVNNLYPITRKGYTAAPLALDYLGEPKFLLDASVFGGSSGSPIYLHKSGMIKTRSGEVSIGGEQLFLVGIVTEVFYRENEHDVESRTIPTDTNIVKTRTMLNLGVALHSRVINEAVHHHLPGWMPKPDSTP